MKRLRKRLRSTEALAAPNRAWFAATNSDASTAAAATITILSMFVLAMTTCFAIRLPGEAVGHVATTVEARRYLGVNL